MKDCSQCRLTMKRGECHVYGPYKWQGGQMKNLLLADRRLRKKELRNGKGKDD
jgi:hypothetical protein